MSAGERPRSLRALAGVLAANAAAWSATRLLSVALPWFVLSSTGSATTTGMVVFGQTGCYVVAQILSGPLIDRIGARPVSIACDLVGTVALAAVPVLHLAGALPIGALMALTALAGAADGPSNSAKGVLVPAATRAARVPLERGTGLVGAAERTASTVGPAIAGVLVATLGGVSALWVAAALLAAGALIVALALPGQRPPAAPAEGYGYRLRRGASFLRGDGLLSAIVGMVAVTNLLDQAFMAVLLPVWAKSAGHGPQAVGLVASVFAAASVAASLTAAAVGDRLPRRAVYLVGFVVGGVPRFAAMALGLPLVAVLAVMAVGGLGSGFINPIIGAVTYERVPAGLLGRVRTMSQALAFCGIPFGGLAGAGLLAVAGLTGTLWIVGGCYLVAVVLPGLRREWSAMNRPRPTPANPAPAVPAAEH